MHMHANYPPTAKELQSLSQECLNFDFRLIEAAKRCLGQNPVYTTFYSQQSNCRVISFRKKEDKKEKEKEENEKKRKKKKEIAV